MLLEEERKKVLLQDDTEDEAIYNKINNIKNSLLQDTNQEESETPVSLNKIGDAPEFDVLRNEELVKEINRPSDVVNFEDKSDYQDLVKIKTNENLFQENNVIGEIELTKEDYNEDEGEIDHKDSNSSEKEEDDVDGRGINIDQARNEIENQLDMIKHEIKHLQEKQKSEMEREYEWEDGESENDNQEIKHTDEDFENNENNLRNDEDSAEINLQEKASKNVSPPQDFHKEKPTHKVSVPRKEWKNLHKNEYFDSKVSTKYHRKHEHQQHSNNKDRRKAHKKEERNKQRKEELKRLLKLYEEKQKLKYKPHNSEAAIIIQKWVRGFLERKEYGNFKNNIKKIRKLRR